MPDHGRLSVSPTDSSLRVGRFQAMASDCELLLEVDDPALAEAAFDRVVTEVTRIERKFSRYIPESCIGRINRAEGKPQPIDEETYRLLVFADHLFRISDGLFDITSGVLRQAWAFDGSTQIPSEAHIAQCLPKVGWDRVKLTSQTLTLGLGMELDLGGIGKEYAVDKAFGLVESLGSFPFLINLGGDLRARGPRINGQAWSIGIENPESTQDVSRLIQINTSAVATSGNSKRYVQQGDLRWGHLLNPKTGWPIPSKARSVTVAADTCTTAGMLTSLALLSTDGPEAFLQQQTGLAFWMVL